MDFEKARHLMVETQVRTNKVIDDRVLNLFRTLPREQFLPRDKVALAYSDAPIPLATGRAFLPPMVQARLLEAFSVAAGERVLHIGTLFGFTPVCLALLGAVVTTVESIPELAASARALVRLHAPMQGVELVQAGLSEGAPNSGVFDAVFVDAGVEVWPEAIVRQVKKGGRLVAICGQKGTASHGAIWHKNNEGKLTKRMLFDMAAPVLEGFGAGEGFAF